ncbi:MAG: phytanoyl-CoA dioxygenase family protein [Deltaproteobacteria bacterium]
MTTNAPLSAEAIQQYQEEGYLIPDCQLPESRLNELMEAVERVLVTNPEVRPEKLVSVHISGLNQEGVRGDDAFMELAKDPMIVDCVEQLIGPDIILWGCQLFCKPGTDGMEVPMHQDGAYWPIRPLATCTVWVALDHVTEENGCMRVVPGSHRHQSLSHQKESREDLVLNQRVNDGRIDPENTVSLELAPGQFSMHDVHLVHGSHPNRSGKRRAGLAIRYMPSTSLFNRDLIDTGTGSGYLINFAQRPLWLIRGENKAGSDLKVGHA